MHTVAFVASRGSIGGGEIYLLDVLRHLDRARFRPLVVLPQPGAFQAALAEAGVEAVVIPVDYGWFGAPLPWYGFLRGYEQRVQQLTALMRERGVALVHTNSNQNLEGAVAATLAGVPHVHVVHIPFQHNLPIYAKLGIDGVSFAQLVGALATRIVAVAEPVARSLAPPLARERIEVIHNGIDLARYLRGREQAGGQVRRELGIAADAPLVCGVGRLHHDKGFDTFVDVAAAVLQRHPQAHFVIVGAADTEGAEAALRQRIREHGAEARVTLAGFRNDVPALLAESDVFLLTSRVEGGPYVLVEAMASGCACVATRCGGFVEHVVRDGETGFLVDVGDTAAAADRVARCIGDLALRRRIADAGVEFMRGGEFDARRSVARLMAVYEGALRAGGPAGGGVGATLFLQAAREIGALGVEVAELKERVKRAERAADLVLDNPVAATARRLFRGARRR